MDIAALVLLTVIFGIQLAVSKIRFAQKRNGFWILVFSILIAFGFCLYQSWQQYSLWKNDEMGKLLLPSYQGLSYFIFYVRTRFFNSYLLSLFFGILFLLAAKKLDKKFGGRFFEPVEPYLLGTSIFLAGHPGWLLYLALLFIIYFLMHLAALTRINADQNTDNRRLNIGANQCVHPRVSAYYVWLLAAIFTIIISRWLAALPWWQILKF